MVAVTSDCHVQFINNSTSNTGGVFTISNSVIFFNQVKDGTKSSSGTNPVYFCFLSTSTEERSLQATFEFVDNSAGKGGDILYGGHLARALDGNLPNYGEHINSYNCLNIFPT